MANPNIVNVTNIQAQTICAIPGTTAETDFVVNTTGSNSVLKINLLQATNNSGSNAGINVRFYNNTDGSTSYLAKGMVVPTTGAVIVIDKSSAVYITENTKITVTSLTGGAIDFLASYEVIA